MLFQNEVVIVCGTGGRRVSARGAGRRAKREEGVRVERQVAGQRRRRRHQQQQQRRALSPGASRQGDQEGKEGEESQR